MSTAGTQMPKHAPQICPFLRRDPDPHLIYGPKGPKRTHPKRLLDQFSHVCWSHTYDQQTRTQITLLMQQQAAPYAMHCDVA